jgi:hypothetical protein
MQMANGGHLAGTANCFQRLESHYLVMNKELQKADMQGEHVNPDVVGVLVGGDQIPSSICLRFAAFPVAILD